MNLEASWLGPWRCLLLGDLSNLKLPDSVILGGGIENFEGEACVAQLSLRNGCYVGRGGYLYEEDSWKAGSVPSAEELTKALKSHDLFLYFGHGSAVVHYGSKAATSHKAYHSSYLLAGSPAIVANLWDVTDRDIDRFGKALLEGWLRERSDSPSSSEGGCSQCESLANELAVMNLKGNTTKRTRKPRNKPGQSNADGSGKMECNHKHGRKIGSFIAAAREVCTLPYLIGAAPVCYGVPTGITRKKGIEPLLLPSSSSC
ncbi:Separase [Raphanus sativus]|nr:Separase [Raphanus sativus]